MSDTTASDTARADAARKKLLRDILEIKKMGNQMIENTETAIQRAPVMLGLGLGVVALLGVAVLASRRQKPRFPGFRRERSFFAEAARGAALSAIGILSGRLTHRLLAGAIDDKPQGANSNE